MLCQDEHCGHRASKKSRFCHFHTMAFLKRMFKEEYLERLPLNDQQIHLEELVPSRGYFIMGPNGTWR
jgi:hypothetical protein